MNIISCNIRFDNPADNEHDWNGRREYLASVINSKTPVILGTQEGREPQLRDLESLLEDLTLVDSHREWIQERMYPCLYVNTEVFEIISSGDIWLSQTPYITGSKSFNSAFPRLCTWAKLQLKNSEKSFFVVNVHLDHLDTNTRQEQIKVLLKEVANNNTESLPVILMGDFNESPEGIVREIINNSPIELVDSWQELGIEEETTHHSFKGFRENGKRIDWILTDPSFQVETIHLIKDHKDGLYPTDHFPVYLKIK